MKLGVYLYGISLNQSLTCLVVALRLDALYLAEKLTEQLTKTLEVVDYNILLAILRNPLDNILLLALLVAPLGNKLTVTHVVLLYGLAGFDARELSHNTIHNIVGILCPRYIQSGDKANLNQLLIAKVVECEEVGTSLLQG